MATQDSDVRIASGGPELEAVRSLWTEYWDSLRLPGDFQGFAAELGMLPGPYGPPRGLLLLARVGGVPGGTAALRPLKGSSCEAKRLFVRPEFRGRGIAASLLNRIISGARQLGYDVMYGDTLPSMKEARQVYARLGFEEVPPYSDSPTPGAIYLRLVLSGLFSSREGR